MYGPSLRLNIKQAKQHAESLQGDAERRVKALEDAHALATSNLVPILNGKRMEAPASYQDQGNQLGKLRSYIFANSLNSTSTCFAHAGHRKNRTMSLVG
jgi:hypothetical protein